MLAIIIESGLVYTIGVVLDLVLSMMNHPGMLVIIGILSQTAVGFVDPSRISSSLSIGLPSISFHTGDGANYDYCVHGIRTSN